MYHRHEHAPEYPVPATPSHGLSAADERDLLKQVQRGQCAQFRLAHESDLAHDQRRDLHRRIAAGNEARERLITAHLDLVHACVAQIPHHTNTDEDLLQEGSLALTQAVDDYIRQQHRWRLGLVAYAVPVITTAITQSIAAQGYPVRLPADLVVHVGAFRKQVAMLTQHLRRAPTPRELARHLHLSITQVALLRWWSGSPCSLDMVATYTATPPDTMRSDAERAALDDAVKQMVANLACPYERKVVQLLYGLNGRHVRLSPHAVSRRLKVRPRHVHRWHRSALSHLHHQCRMFATASSTAN